MREGGREGGGKAEGEITSERMWGNPMSQPRGGEPGGQVSGRVAAERRSRRVRLYAVYAASVRQMKLCMLHRAHAMPGRTDTTGACGSSSRPHRQRATRRNNVCAARRREPGCHRQRHKVALANRVTRLECSSLHKTGRHISEDKLTRHGHLRPSVTAYCAQSCLVQTRCIDRPAQGKEAATASQCYPRPKAEGTG